MVLLVTVLCDVFQYYLMYKIQTHLEEKLKPVHKRKILGYFHDSWIDLHNPLHSVGFIVHPKFQDYEQSANEQLQNDLLIVIEKWDIEDLMVLIELSKYRTKVGIFGRESALKSRDGDKGIDPVEWWLIYGAATPTLQKLAQKVLIQCWSASRCKTNWSSWGYVVNSRRNKLKPQNAVKLIYVNGNIRALNDIEALD